jgi:hypothetical protein
MINFYPLVSTMTHLNYVVAFLGVVAAFSGLGSSDRNLSGISGKIC